MIEDDDLPRPEAAAGQLLVRVKAAGVGPWDALVREGKSGLRQPLPLTLGSELSGIVEQIVAEISRFKTGDEVYWATNDQFTGAYAEYAVPSAKMMSQKPLTLDFIEPASAPIVAVTAWQMLFDYAHVTAGQIILIHGAAGNVGVMPYNWQAKLVFMQPLQSPPPICSSDREYVAACQRRGRADPRQAVGHVQLTRPG